MKRMSLYSAKASNIPLGIGIGLAGSVIGTLVGSLILAWLIQNQFIDEGSAGLGVMLIHVISAAIGALIAWGRVRQKRLVLCLLSCTAYFASLILMALPFGTGFESVIPTFAMVLLGGGFTLIPAMLGNKSGGRRYKIATIR